MKSVDTNLDVLVIEDSDYLRELAIEFLRELGHKVVAVPDAEAALVILENQTFDVMMTDINLPGVSGLALAEDVAGRHPKLPIVIASGHEVIMEVLLRDKLQRNFLVLKKPYDLETLQHTISEAVRRGEAASLKKIADSQTHRQ